MRDIIGLLLVGLAISQHWLRKQKSPRSWSKYDPGLLTRIASLDASNAGPAKIRTASRISAPAILTGNRARRRCLLLAHLTTRRR
jgi:hypothetical protein